MPLSPLERAALKRRCSHQVSGFLEADPSQTFAAMAAWSAEHAASHDRYGEGELIEAFEHKIALLLGQESAAVMPSGVMAQLIALRIASERRSLKRFGLHATSHLEIHEERAYQALFQLEAQLVGEPHRVLLAAHLAKVAEPLAALVIELPMREIGGQLPSWDELDSLKAMARSRDIHLHMDGARLWECAAFFERSYAAICAGFDSVYVSLYKGIGALAGAVLAGPTDFIAQARLWRRRMGGTLVHQSPNIISAAMHIDARLALMNQLYARAQAFATTLSGIAGLRLIPAKPQTNMLHVQFDAPAEAILDARDLIAQQHGVWLLGFAQAEAVATMSRTEIYVGDGLLALDDAQVRGLFEALLQHAHSA